jgi:hypothetical protein
VCFVFSQVVVSTWLLIAMRVFVSGGFFANILRFEHVVYEVNSLVFMLLIGFCFWRFVVRLFDLRTY